MHRFSLLPTLALSLRPQAIAGGLACLLALAAPTLSAAAAPASPAAHGIAWQTVSTDAEVDRAFARAKQQGKPVFLYWGAVWCPPCNQVKATLFNRPDFIERTRAFVPVYVDGDKPGAQKVASRFKVAGYPTMILFKPDGTEVTRLPGEVDPERYLLTLTGGMNAQIPVRDMVRQALAGQTLTAEQWRLLAFYSWDTDEQQVLKTEELAQRLSELAQATPADLSAVRDRLMFKAMVARTRGGAAEGKADDASLKLAERLLTQPDAVREVSELFIGYANTAVKHLAAGAEARKALATRWEAVVNRLLEAPGLSRIDQVDALSSRVSLWKLIDGAETLAAPRRDAVQREIAKVVAAANDKYERQALIPSAAYVLGAAGLGELSDQLLKAELPRAVAPYYHMLGLASNAKKRGDNRAALDWYEQAWKKSEGPATRIQWGAGYVNQLVDLAPDDLARVKLAASGVIAQLAPKGETFYERNQRSLQRMSKKLTTWQGNDAKRAEVVSQLKSQLSKTCAKVPSGDAGRGHCEAVFSKT